MEFIKRLSIRETNGCLTVSCLLPYEKFLDRVLLIYLNVCSVCSCTKVRRCYMHVLYLKFIFSSTTKLQSKYQYHWQTRIHDFRKQAKAKHKAQGLWLEVVETIRMEFTVRYLPITATYSISSAKRTWISGKEGGLSF